MLVASPERISQDFLTMRHQGRCQGILCSADCEAEDIWWYQVDIWWYQGALCSAARSCICHFHLQAPASPLGTPHISPGCLRALQPGKSEQGKFPRDFWAMTPRLIITLAEVAAVVQTCLLTRDSEWKCQNRGMAWSEELLLEVFISMKASLKNISGGARETTAVSNPACCLCGRDSLWGPQKWQCCSRDSSHIVCGQPWAKWVSPGSGDVSHELFGACLAEAAFIWQPPSCSEHRKTEP